MLTIIEFVIFNIELVYKFVDLMNILVVDQLTKYYSTDLEVPALDHISFHMLEGEILGLVGPNGSGKTTTIQILLGTLTPSEGAVTYFGKDFRSHRSEILQYISFASTYASLPWNLTIAENLEIFGLIYGLAREESHRKFDPLLERFGIMNKKYKPVTELSAGQVTRLLLVKAFFIDPRIVLLDEPTASLDPDIAKDICAFLLEQRDTKGMSLLFTSHKMQEVTEICDRTIFLKKGRVIADDLPKNLARSVSKFRLSLVIADGLKRTLEIIQAQGLQYRQDHRTLEISLDEEEIPSFLHAISEAHVSYASIRIDEPSLDDYFFEITKRAI